MSEFYTVGKLSKILGISADTLRYYDEIGLLKPKHTDRDSGYRYYTIDQAAQVNRILEFKEFGFRLSEIGEMLAGGALADVCRKRYSALICEKLRMDGIIEKLAGKIKNLEKEEDSSVKNRRKERGRRISNGDLCAQRMTKSAGKKVLLVDDAAFLRMMCRDVLGKAGFEIVGEAENGEEGVEKFKELSPDLVILNIVMPRMDGIEALGKIISHDPNARVIMLSAVSQRAVIAEALSLGARRFVAKPFQGDGLIESAREALESATKCNPETFYVEPVEMQTDDAPAPDPDPTHALLVKIIEGQEEIKELLQKSAPSAH